jgi:hypothetical protein
LLRARICALGILITSLADYWWFPVMTAGVSSHSDLHLPGGICLLFPTRDLRLGTSLDDGDEPNPSR